MQSSPQFEPVKMTEADQSETASANSDNCATNCSQALTKSVSQHSVNSQESAKSVRFSSVAEVSLIISLTAVTHHTNCSDTPH